MPGAVESLRERVSDFTMQHRIMQESTATEVLDSAFDIYFQAELLKAGVEDVSLVDRSYVDKCSRVFLQVLQELLGTTDEIEVLSRMELRLSRNKVEGMDSGFLPGQTSRLNAIINPFTATTAVQFKWRKLASEALALKRGQLMVVEPGSRQRDQGIGLGARPTRMFTPREREPYRVFFRGRSFQRFDRYTLEMEPFSTLGMQSHGKLHFAAYVIAPDGEMFAFNHLDKADQVAHSSLVGGGPVRAAGEICIVGGRLHVITTHSGHYRPGRDNLHQTLLFFREKGLDLGQALVHFVADPELRSPKQQLPPIKPVEPQLKQLLDMGDIDFRDVRAYLSLTSFVYRASDILAELRG